MSDSASKAARAKYLAAYQNITMADRQARHDEIAARKADEIERRRALGAAYLERHAADIVVPPEHAVVALDLVAQTAAAVAEARRLTEGRSAEIDNGALEFPVLGHEFAADGPAIALGITPMLLAPIVRYFGMMPILFNAFVTRAHNTTLRTDTAHRFHLDPEDTRSFKIFLHLTDVDDDCGPLHVLPADLSRKVLDAVDYRGVSYLDDEQVAELVGWDNVVRVTGPPGTVALADTTRCLHFGGRPRAPGKPVREMLVFHYLVPTSLLLAGETPPRRFLPQLEATGDDWFSALLG